MSTVKANACAIATLRLNETEISVGDARHKRLMLAFMRKYKKAAALMTGKISPAAVGTTCIVLSGGNVDMGLVPNLVRRHETEAGRRLIAFIRLPDRPGAFAGLLQICAGTGANLIEVQHVREGIYLHARETGIQLVLEIRGQEHANELLALAKEQGYDLNESQIR